MKGRTPRLGLLIWLGVLTVPTPSKARRSKVPPQPTAWSYEVAATRTVQTVAKGEGAASMPPALALAHTDDLRWTARGGIDHVNPDGSLTELLRLTAPDTLLDGRAFGLRRFDDGEVLKVERFQELADTGLAGWDPILLGLSPARPDRVTAKAPGKRALQWTARLGTARFLRSNCPAVWTLVDDGGVGVDGWLGRPVEHVRYTATCGLNGRADVENGGPVPIRGQGKLSGEVWWDVDTHQVIRHAFTLERTVRSRWVSSAGPVEIEQVQQYDVEVSWSPADVAPVGIRTLPTRALSEIMPELVSGWGACADDGREREVTLEAGPAGSVVVRAVHEPRAAVAAVPSAAARPGFMIAPESAPDRMMTEPLVCWQAVADSVSLPAHDEDGVRFTFVVPRHAGGFGTPGVIDRSRAAPGALFVVAPSSLVEATEAWLGVR